MLSPLTNDKLGFLLGFGGLLHEPLQDAGEVLIGGGYGCGGTDYDLGFFVGDGFPDGESDVLGFAGDGGLEELVHLLLALVGFGLVFSSKDGSLQKVAVGGAGVDGADVDVLRG